MMSAADELRVPHGECPQPNRNMDDVRRWAYYRIGAMMGPTDTGMVHGPHDLPAAQLLEIMRRSNVARCFRPAGSTLAPAIGLPVHGPVR